VFVLRHAFDLLVVLISCRIVWIGLLVVDALASVEIVLETLSRGLSELGGNAAMRFALHSAP